MLKFAHTLTFCVPLLVPLPAMAAAVYAGCSVPTQNPGHNTFYVDPVNGSLSGDGSAANPWSTLADVVNPANKLIATRAYSNKTATFSNINPTAPIKAGDLILLRTGDHGSPKLLNMFNTDFITVAAAPGATPVVDAMAVVSSGKWMFQGITFQGMATTATGATTANPSPNNFVTAGRGDYTGKTTDIVFSGNSFSAAASTDGWTDYDWINKPFSLGLWTQAPCISIVDNHFYNLMNGLMVWGDKTLVQGNLIEAFANDGIDIAASNLLIKSNLIQGGVNTSADPYHADGIQGWTNGGATNKNVVIDSNTIIKTGDSTVTYLQGISIFDGKWDNLTIQNNVVVTNTSNGIVLLGGANSRILNNTLASSNSSVQPMLEVAKAKDQTLPSSVYVRNNIASFLAVATPGVITDHNVIAGGRYIDLVNAVATNVTTSNMSKLNILIKDVSSVYVTANIASETYDLRLKAGSPAIGIGSTVGAPLTDITGAVRSTTVDLGAFAFSSVTALNTTSAVQSQTPSQ